MNIVITTFNNPFSFYCLGENDSNTFCISLNNKTDTNNVPLNKSEISDSLHGQYVAVMWQNKWARGIVTLESQFLIWLIDYGIYLRPTENTVYINLPNEFKHHPTKIFEASIHGVTPIDKALTDDCQIKNVVSHIWNKGAIEKAKEVIASAHKLHFIPVALLMTEHNEVVLGDLYIENNDNKIVNIIEELEMWPVFAEKNKEVYIKNLSASYTNRRRHRASHRKPHIPNIPTMTFKTTIEEYSIICSKAPELDIVSECNSVGEDGSTVLDHSGNYKKNKKPYRLTTSEIEAYSKMFVTISGREYNALNILMNKINDLCMCERYKNYDRKGVGRGTTRRINN